MKGNFLKKQWFGLFVLLLILATSFFLRTYNFRDWLYFKMDQARDANLISHAIEQGPGLLPLLGPRAGATEVDNGYLRLGPIFYYFQYLSGKIFNSTEPEVYAYPDLFFSLATIPLLYLFLKIYFSRNMSLLVTMMYSFSFIIIQYSRFAWNPNSLQFFTILTFFSLLKTLSENSRKKRLVWIALWSLALAIGSQLHFFGFFALAAISGLLILFHFQIWNKSNFKKIFEFRFFKTILMHASIAVVVFAFIYMPVIISDVVRKGENAQNFFQALGSKPSNKPFLSKITKNFDENTKYFCLITTAFCNEGDAKENPVPAVLTLTLFASGIFLAVSAFRKTNDLGKKNFLALLLIWLSVFFILTIPVAFQLRPRFFILVFAVPFILIGVLFDFFKNRLSKYSPYLIAIFSVLIMGSNFYGTLDWFGEQKNSQLKDVEIDRTLILKTKDGVTLGQLQRAADFMYSKKKDGATIYFYVKPEHVQPIKYLLSRKKDETLKYFPLTINDDPNAQYFAIIPSHSGLDPFVKKYGNDVKTVSQKNLGQIAIFELDFPSRPVNKNFRFNEKASATDRVFWRDIFGKENTENITEDIEMNE